MTIARSARIATFSSCLLRRLTAFAVIALAASSLFAVVPLAAPAASASTGTPPVMVPAAWANGQPVSPPTGASTSAELSLDALSCYSSGNCSAVGTYQDASGSTQGMLVTETSGSWGQATAMSPPQNAAGQPHIALSGISCANAVDCTAVGSYQAATGQQQAFGTTESNGNWALPSAVGAPNGAATDPQAALDAVSCTNAGICTAVGTYTDTSGATQAMVTSTTSGKFPSATTLSLPSGAATNPQVTIGSVSCSTSTSCTAVGTYLDSSNDRQAMEITETGGTWGTAVELSLPADAATNPNANLDSVSCVANTDCTAFGSYVTTSGNTEAMAAVDLGGTWAQAIAIAAPANAYPDPNAVLTAGSCTATNGCTAVGSYTDTNATTQAMVVVEAGGIWSQAGVLAAPSASSLNPNSTLAAIDCPSPASCSAVGGYDATSGGPSAQTLDEVTSPTFTVGTTSTYSVISVGSSTPALTEAGTLPAGLTFQDQGDGIATLSGDPKLAGTGLSSVTITASSPAGQVSGQFSLLVDAAPAITSPAATTFATQTDGSFTFTASGYPAATFAETGTLPAGVTLSSAGVLAGSPNAGTGGSYPIQVTATNSVGASASQSFTLTVNQGAQQITSAVSATFTVGTPGTFTFTSVGGNPTPSFSLSGALPTGVSLSPSGVLSGVPAAGTGGAYPLVVSASNGIGTPATQDFTLLVDEAPSLTNGNSVTFTAGHAAQFNLAASGYPAPTYSESGALPSGMSFVNGVLTGTPAPAAGAAGGTGATNAASSGASTTSYPITFTVKNSAGSSVQSFLLTVNQAPNFTSTNNATFAVGQANAIDLTASGLPAPSFSEQGALPPGVTLSSSGVLSGVPAPGSGGQYVVTVIAKNGVGSPASQIYTLDIDEAPKITSADKTTFVIGYIDNFRVHASGFPVSSFTESGTLPAGVIFVNGKFTGVPTGAAPVSTSTATTGGAPTTTQPATSTTGSSAAKPAPVPIRYPITITASNGIGRPSVQTFEIVLAHRPPPSKVVLAPVVSRSPVAAIGGAKPTAVAVHVACHARRCGAALVLVQGKTKKTKSRVVGRTSMAITKLRGVVKIDLNRIGQSVLAGAAKSHRIVVLELVEITGKHVKRFALRIRA
ncbi:MAG: putative Ig domain-containing protein [Actinomycetota bacterium]|nr:putative Ig domain-containing protein [Actinomycetota bacterium]